MALTFQICCLSCGKVFLDTESRPCVGACGHRVCYTCILDGADSTSTSSCPICRLDEAFDVIAVDHQLEAFVNDLRDTSLGFDFEQLKWDLEQIDSGKCAKCEKAPEKLHFCVTCYPLLGLLEKTDAGKWLLKMDATGYLDPEQSLAVTKEGSMCSECARKHKAEKQEEEEHEMVPLRHVENIFQVEDAYYTKKYRELQEQRAIMHNGYGSLTGALEHFSAQLAQYETRVALRATNPPIHVTPVLCVDERLQAHLEACRHEIRKKHAETEKLLDWNIMHTATNLLKHAQFAALHQKDSRELRELYGRMPKGLLTEPEIHRIDAEIVRRMEALETNFTASSKFKLLFEAPNYSKYRAITRELAACYEEHVRENQVRAGIMLELMAIERQSQMASAAVQEMWDRQLMHKQLEVDASLSKSIEVLARRNYALLMISKFFSPFQDCTCEDKVLRNLISRFLAENIPQDFINQYSL